MSSREQIRLELVKALLAQHTMQVVSQLGNTPDPSAGPYPGMLHRVDALEVIVSGSPEPAKRMAHVSEIVAFPAGVPSDITDALKAEATAAAQLLRGRDLVTLPNGFVPANRTVAVYRKKPVNVEARQFVNNNDSNADLDGIVVWITFNGGQARHDGTSIYIQTPEGEMRADIKDWIIRGVKGEFYPCKPDVFEASYEHVRQG